MKYIEKTIALDSGDTASCWIATGGTFDLANNRGGVQLSGWLDVAAYNSGKTLKEIRWRELTLSSITAPCGAFPIEFLVYDALWATIATMLISDPASDWYGGIIKDS